ncbi:hypothetical protein [Tissierella sp.]|uniref:hypothetical protein n=1 Tax=Tissierella sp. TaxID=41274 RepID=UPI003047860C
MNKIDKYKIAAEVKKNDPTMTHKEALELAKIAEKLYFEDNYPVKEAIEKAKEMLEKKVI